MCASHAVLVIHFPCVAIGGRIDLERLYIK